jgi:hypothetical protein
MIEVEQDLIEGVRLAITTQICISVWSDELKDKQALQVWVYFIQTFLVFFSVVAVLLARLS